MLRMKIIVNNKIKVTMIQNKVCCYWKLVSKINNINKKSTSTAMYINTLTCECLQILDTYKLSRYMILRMSQIQCFCDFILDDHQPFETLQIS